MSQPKIKAYPKCNTCDVAYVLRLAHVLGDQRWTHEWVWQRDCKHKKAPPKLVKVTTR